MIWDIVRLAPESVHRHVPSSSVIAEVCGNGNAGRMAAIRARVQHPVPRGHGGRTHSEDFRMRDDRQRAGTLHKTVAYCDTCLSESLAGLSIGPAAQRAIPPKGASPMDRTYIRVESNQEILAISLESRDPDLDERLSIPLHGRLGPLRRCRPDVRVPVLVGSAKTAR